MDNRLKFSLISLGVIFGAAAAFDLSYQSQKEAVTFTVTDKEVVVSGSGESISSTYLVFTQKKDGKEEVFANSDSWLSGKYNSSDIQGHLKEGQTYTADAIGFRNNFWSVYRNLTNVKDVPVVSVPATPAP